MDFREYYATQLNTRAQLQKLQHTHLHTPFLKKQPNRLSTQTVLCWVGKRLETWGHRLQKRYNNEPRMAQ